MKNPILTIECTAEQKATYLKAADGQKLGAWALAALDEAAAMPADDDGFRDWDRFDEILRK